MIVRSLVAAALAAVFHLFMREAFEGTLGHNVDAVAGFLHVFGAIYGTVLAFLIFVVWGQFNGTEAGVAREARAIQEMVRLCRAGRSQGCREVIEAVHAYASAAGEDEWKALADGKPCTHADACFLKVQEQVLRTDANTEIEELTRETIIRVMERAAELRAERLALSATRIPPTLWYTLMFSTVLLCASVGLLGSSSTMLGIYMSGGITLMVTLILGVVNDMDNPFNGTYNASNKPLLELRTV